MTEPRVHPVYAYEYHRAITLVQTLAIYPNRELLEQLATGWQCVDECGRKIEHLPQGDLIEMLAKYALEQVRQDNA
jgi:hypothetical protein